MAARSVGTLKKRPQTPEIITCGDGCAFRWNAEKSNPNILPK